jgi:hypothetical protein
MCFAMTGPQSISPDIVDELYGLADSLMQGSGKTVVISYANIRFAADEIKRLRASLQPATPTSCPYKGPFGCKCEPGECKYRAGGDAVAGEAKALAELLRAVKSCDSYVNPESGIAAKMAAYEDALRSPDVAATPTDIGAIHHALGGANIPYTGYSCNGVNLIGDSKSIMAAKEAFHSHGQIDEFRTQIRHWREECGKLHAKLAQAPDAAQPAAVDMPKWLRDAFDGDSVPKKNIALRMAYDEIVRLSTPISSTLRCPNGLEHGNCLHPNCVSSCPGRLALTSPEGK